MDNVTHSLVGYALGQTLTPRGQKAHRALILAAVVGANLPDADTLWAGIVSGKIGTLLNHRGHTHTLVMLIPQLAVIMGALYLWRRWRWRSGDPSAWPWGRITLACSLGLLSHLALDYWNNYGLHPFWPFNNDWFYGDAVFILEPWVWWLTIPALTALMVSRFWKAVSWVLLCSITVFAFIAKFVDPQIAVAGVIAAGIGAFLGRKTRLGLVWVWATLIVLVTTQFALSHRVYSGLLSSHVVDVIRSPYPSNPRCWQFARVLKTDDLYKVQLGTVVLGGASLERCRFFVTRPGFEKNRAPLRPVTQTETGFSPSQIQWEGEFVAPLRELAELARNCRAYAFLRFSRAPYFFEKDGAIFLGDLRYERGGDFATFKIEKIPTQCPQHLPHWNPPLETHGVLTKS